MLILQRKQGQSFTIGENIVITVREIGMGRVRLSVDAPRDIPILRTELIEARQENVAAAAGQDAPLELLELLWSHAAPQVGQHEYTPETVQPKTAHELLTETKDRPGTP